MSRTNSRFFFSIYFFEILAPSKTFIYANSSSLIGHDIVSGAIRTIDRGATDPVC